MAVLLRFHTCSHVWNCTCHVPYGTCRIRSFVRMRARCSVVAAVAAGHTKGSTLRFGNCCATGTLPDCRVLPPPRTFRLLPLLLVSETHSLFLLENCSKQMNRTVLTFSGHLASNWLVLGISRIMPISPSSSHISSTGVSGSTWKPPSETLLSSASTQPSPKETKRLLMERLPSATPKTDPVHPKPVVSRWGPTRKLCCGYLGNRYPQPFCGYHAVRTSPQNTLRRLLRTNTPRVPFKYAADTLQIP